MLDCNEEIKISNLEIDAIVKRIMALSLDKIDLLWKKSEWVDSEAQTDKRKALPNWRLGEIKNNKAVAEESFINLISDEPYSVLRQAALFLNNLFEIENSLKKK